MSKQLRHLWTSNNKQILKFDISVYIYFLMAVITNPHKLDGLK